MDRPINKVLITGATGGIGREIALQFVRGGKDVYVTGRCQNKLNDLVIELNREKTHNDQMIGHFRFDVGWLTDIQNVMPQICTVKCDTVIFNAGIMFPKEPRQANEDDHPLMEDTLKTNVVGHFLMARHLLKEHEQPIRFVCLSSVTANFPRWMRWKTSPSEFEDFFARSNLFTDGWTSYIDSKLGAIVMAQWLNEQDRVSAVAVHPGVATTNIVESIPRYQRRLLYPLTIFQRIDGPVACAKNVIAAARTTDDFTNKWICHGTVTIPSLNDVQKNSFMHFLHGLTNDFM